MKFRSLVTFCVVAVLPLDAVSETRLEPVLSLLLEEAGYSECALPNSYVYEDYLSANRSWNYLKSRNSAYYRLEPESERFELRPGDCGRDDCDRTPHYERTEMAQEDQHRSREGDEIWWGWSLYVPGNFRDGGNDPRSARGTSMFQFQQCCEWDPVFMFIKHYNSAMKLGIWRTQPHLGFREIELIPHAQFKSRWHDFVVHAKWTGKTSGFLRVWINGSLKADYKGRTRSSGNRSVYHKYGLYRSAHDTNPSRQAVYIDEVRRGDRRECVDIRMILEKLNR